MVIQKDVEVIEPKIRQEDGNSIGVTNVRATISPNVLCFTCLKKRDLNNFIEHVWRPLRESNATRPLSRRFWRCVHDSEEILGLSKILVKLFQHRILIL